MTKIGFVALLGVAAVASACGPARRGEPVAPPVSFASAEAERGQRVFMTSCQQCHPGGAAGLGPALNNKPLPRFAIKYQVRHGLGAMPAFGPDEISDDKLDALATYLIALRDRN